MKKIVFILMACVCAFSVFSVSCAKPKTHTVTFVQSGYEDIVKTVQDGGTLTDIPKPVATPGFEVKWNVTDFTNIKKDMTVTAIVSPKTITISLIINNTQYTDEVVNVQFKYGEKFTLPLPKNTANYEFKTWQLVGNRETVYQPNTEYAYQGTQDFQVIALWTTWSLEH